MPLDSKAFDQYLITFNHAARHASRDYDEMGLGFVKHAASRMRQSADGKTPYADGYIARVNEFIRMEAKRK